MSKKFLSFTGRLACRRNGLIDITSPSDELAGFRVTLKPGTDSHTIAAEALQDAGLVPAASSDVFYSDLYHDSKELSKKVC